jgi:hypothetical protein
MDGHTGVALSAEQRGVLDDINASLAEDFALRRRMLLKRVDVTLQSFLWAEKAQGALFAALSGVCVCGWWMDGWMDGWMGGWMDVDG